MVITFAFRLVNYNLKHVAYSRCIHSNLPLYVKSSTLKTEQRKLKGYLLSKYMQYVKNYESLLEKRFPSAFRVYRVFSLGIKDFYNDLMSYLAIRQKVQKEKNGEGLAMLSRMEIEVYHHLPRDMFKVTPVLLLSAVPFANYVVFPVAYLMPKTFLSSHFWSLQQKATFSVDNLRKRLLHNRPVLRALQVRQYEIKDIHQQNSWREILGMLGSGVHPSTAKIISCAPIFINFYNLDNLQYSHISHLLRMHGLHRGWFRRKRLRRRAFILHELDKAIVREGGVAKLPLEALKQACFMRGLNAANMSNEQLREWLENWLRISKTIQVESFSLLLHCPILMAYNKPQNWTLIH